MDIRTGFCQMLHYREGERLCTAQSKKKEKPVFSEELSLAELSSV